MDLAAYMAAQAELKREKEKKDKLARAKAEAAKRSSAHKGEAKEEVSKPVPAPTAHEAEIARLRALLAQKEKEVGKKSEPPISSSSSAREADLMRELDAVKAKVAAGKAKPAPVPTTISDSARRQEDLKRQIEEAKKALAADTKPAPSESAKREDAMLRELEELKRALATAKPTHTASVGTGMPSDSARREEALKREIEELRARETASSSRATAAGATAGGSETLVKLRKELDDLKIKAGTPATASTATVSASAARVSDLERERLELLKKLSDGPSTAALSTARMTARTEVDRINYGVDVCFLVDCTGSMGAFIEAVRTKIMEIIQEINRMEKNAYMRFAFVGYRDHCDGQDRIVKVDFVHDIPGSAFEPTLKACRAKGGGDGPEDVTGGLEEATTLSWKSSTRLVIHFADAPCHGSNYHQIADDYPGGCPRGLIPEDLLRVLISKRVDYYFMKITQHTETMVRLFSEVYLSVGKVFTVASIDAAASDFVPKVVNSISSSMARSYRR